MPLKELRVKLAAGRTFSNILFMSYVYNFPLMEGREVENNPRSDEMPYSLGKQTEGNKAITEENFEYRGGK